MSERGNSSINPLYIFLKSILKLWILPGNIDIWLAGVSRPIFLYISYLICGTGMYICLRGRYLSIIRCFFLGKTRCFFFWSNYKMFLFWWKDQSLGTRKIENNPQSTCCFINFKKREPFFFWNTIKSENNPSNLFYKSKNWVVNLNFM